MLDAELSYQMNEKNLKNTSHISFGNNYVNSRKKNPESLFKIFLIS